MQIKKRSKWTNLLFRLDWLIIIIVIGLTVISLFSLYTTLPPHYETDSFLSNIVIKQSMFILIGIILLSFIALRLNTNYLQFMPIALIVWGINLVLLIAVLIFSNKIAGTHRWFTIDNFTLQPSEYMKYSLIIWLSSILSHDKLKIKKRLILYSLSVFVTSILIFLEPDAGTTIIILFISFFIFILWALNYEITIKTLKNSILVGLVIGLTIAFNNIYILGLLIPVFIFIILKEKNVAIILGGAIFLTFTMFLSLWGLWHWNILKDYQKKRLEPYIQAYKQYGLQGILKGKTEETFHTRQSKIAIGSGKLTGKGASLGTQSRLSFLPEYRTDFFYAAFSEEFGLIGAIVILTLYTILLFKIMIHALKTDNLFIKLVLIGGLAKLWLEIFVNIGMNLAILPTKGVALPFLSYGGSGTIANLIFIGIIESFIAHKDESV